MSCRILGIDPGSRITGLGVIDITGQSSHAVFFHSLRVPPGAWSERLDFIFRGVCEVVTRYQPEEVAVEQVFVQRNVDSALKLGQARGAAIVACTQAGLPVSEYAATQVKKSIVGRGHADKSQIQHMVRMLLGVKAPLPEDAADALAIALCHGHIRASLEHLPGAQGQLKGRSR